MIMKTTGRDRGGPGKPRRPRPDERAPRHDRAQPKGGTANRFKSGAADEVPAKLVRVAGLPGVAALFATAPERVERLYFDTPSKGGPLGGFCKTLALAHKPYNLVTADELEKIAGTAMHGGVVALARPRPLLPLDPDEAAGWARAGEPLLILDGIGNPHNLGAIARTAAFFGLKRMVLSDHPGQAGPSDAAYRVARGGLEHVALYEARRLPLVLRQLAGVYTIAGAALGRGQLPSAYTGEGLRARAKPLALVLGNEEDGLGSETLAACTGIVTIPGAGSARMQSLNVAATAAILVHALLCATGTPTRPERP